MPAREGPSGLTNRAITLEAGVAKGILHNHFTDLDGLLAELMLERFRRIAAQVAKLPARAGAATVDANPTDAVVAVFGAHAAPMVSLAMARPTLLHRLQHAAAAWSPSLQHIEATFAAYLQTEQQLGRISPDADTATLALSLIGTVHHLVLTHRADPSDLSRGVHRIVTASSPASPPSANHPHSGGEPRRIDAGGLASDAAISSVSSARPPCDRCRHPVNDRCRDRVPAPATPITAAVAAQRRPPTTGQS